MIVCTLHTQAACMAGTLRSNGVDTRPATKQVTTHCEHEGLCSSNKLNTLAPMQAKHFRLRPTLPAWPSKPVGTSPCAAEGTHALCTAATARALPEFELPSAVVPPPWAAAAAVAAAAAAAVPAWTAAPARTTVEDGRCPRSVGTLPVSNHTYSYIHTYSIHLPVLYIIRISIITHTSNI